MANAGSSDLLIDDKAKCFGKKTMQITNGGLSNTIEFLTAIITPALLISASGSLVLSTSTRLGRVIDRVRQLTTQLEELIMLEDKESVPLYHEKLEVSFKLLDKVTSRARVLQQAMVAVYRGLGLFVLTSVSIGVIAIVSHYLIFPSSLNSVPIVLGLIGIFFMAYGALLMMQEAQMATDAINTEMDFTWHLAQKVAPEDLSIHLSTKGWHDNESKKKSDIERFRTKIQRTLAKRRSDKKS